MKPKFAILGIVQLALCFAGTLAVSGASFVPIKADYYGLFFETNGFWEQSAGTLTLSTTASGRYSARLQVGPNRYSFSGQFTADGFVSRVILRRFQNPLTVEFQVDSVDRDLIFGMVSDGTWVADLIADRAVFDGRNNVSPDVGQYTMAVPGDFTSTNAPGGASYGTIKIDKAGRLTFAGSLADGTKVSQSTRVSKGGQWPLFVPLYRGDGALYTWMLLNGSSEEDLSGDVTWIALAAPGAWYYPDGWAISLSAIGSRYTRPPRGVRVLDFVNATAEFNGGALESGITNRIVLGNDNRIVNLSANKLSLSISLGNGTFSGRVMDPITWDMIPFRGVVLQRFGVAAGYFPGWHETGEAWIQGL